MPESIYVQNANGTPKTSCSNSDQTGLYFYNARYYDATIGRFISPDSIVPNPANPQSLNRYSYCLNNPLRYTDPSGHGGKPPAGVSPKVWAYFNDPAYHGAPAPWERWSSPQEFANDFFGPASTSSVGNTNSSAVLTKIAPLPAGVTAPTPSNNTPLEAVHTTLNFVGLVFDPADAINGGLYATEGDETNAAWSFGSFIPLAGWGATVGKWTNKADDAVDAGKLISPNQLNQQIKKELAPSGVKRVDKATESQQLHVHFSNGASLNVDGTPGHTKYPLQLTNDQKEWLGNAGWKLPGE